MNSELNEPQDGGSEDAPEIDDRDQAGVGYQEGTILLGEPLPDDLEIEGVGVLHSKLDLAGEPGLSPDETAGVLPVSGEIKAKIITKLAEAGKRGTTADKIVRRLKIKAAGGRTTADEIARRLGEI